ncbi:MAG: RraA family protein [Sphingobium sp.]|nr:RraA family protein [Sphingobium sp.]
MIGFSVNQREKVASAADIERYRSLPVANISDVMNRMPAGGAQLRPLHKGGLLIGPAVTVWTRPGDNLMLHKALDMAVPGDVVVVDGGGDVTNALIGELMIAHARQRGVAGIVINGAVRDFAAISSGDFPVYAVGITHRGPYKDGPGSVNVPIAIGGMLINPGDLVVGDEDGVIAVPLASLDEVFAVASKKHAAEEAQMAAIARGENDRSWVDRALIAAGCPGIVAGS